MPFRQITWKGRYLEHKRRAKMRSIPFLLTFDQWSEIWKQSGHADEMGHCGHQFCMARYGDKGGYEVGNVRIITCSENNSEQWSNMTPDMQARRRQQQSTLVEANPAWAGHARRPEVAAKISATKLGVKHKPHSVETREKIRATNIATKARKKWVYQAFVELPMNTY